MSFQRPSFAELADPGRYSTDAAERLAVELMKEGQPIPERLAAALRAAPPPDVGRAERMLELLRRVTPPARLPPLLNGIIESSNSRIRSKAWKLYAGASEDLEWALERLDDTDARVAANVVEALWRAAPTERLGELFRRAAGQERNRIAGNGLVGLFLLSDPAAGEIAERMARHADPRFRATAAWAIGRGQWRGGLNLLRELARDVMGKVRLNAERSLREFARAA